MTKDPAFLFYSSDFLAGVQDLTMEERGIYITLLCLQHQKGRLTEKMIRLCHGNATADVLAKFRQDENGNYYNERLEQEMEKRRLHGEKQAKRAKEGWEKRKKGCHGNATAYATAMPLENENENINEVILVSNVRELEESKVTNGGFNQKPKQEDFTGPVPEITIGSIQELLRITKNADVTAEHIERMFTVFKVQNLTGKKFYPDRDAVYSHFINWCRSQDWTKHEVSKPSTKNKFKPRPI